MSFLKMYGALLRIPLLNIFRYLKVASKMIWMFLLLWLLPGTFIVFTRAFCYDPSGNLLTSRPDLVPCNGIAGTISMCCKTNTTSNVDTCLPNGLCIEPGPYYWRDACSSSTWPGGDCIKACSSNATVSIVPMRSVAC